MQKIKFPKKGQKIRVSDIGMEDYPEVVMTVWNDPNGHIITKMVYSVTKATDDITDEDAEEYFAAVTEYIMDSNIEGLSFDTIEETKASFEHPSLPFGFLYEFVVLALGKLIEESDRLKKVRVASSEEQGDGDAASTEELKSSSE